MTVKSLTLQFFMYLCTFTMAASGTFALSVHANPIGPELCADGIDNDGDSMVDCDDQDCVLDPACTGGGPEQCSNNTDDDGDSMVDCDDQDCVLDPACTGENEGTHTT